MALPEIAQQVSTLFTALDQHIAGFQQATTLHCKFGCGKCCTKPDIEATILEFIPFALHLYQTNEAENWHNRLHGSADVICKIFNPTQAGAGLCTEYKHRGLICRLFGYSARLNKYGNKELVTCQIIKTEQGEAYNSTNNRIAEGFDVPVLTNYYRQLHAIDPDLSKEFYPINTAIKKAIETVLHYYAYR
jgi:Fe-S-cluster containining protein